VWRQWPSRQASLPRGLCCLAFRAGADCLGCRKEVPTSGGCGADCANLAARNAGSDFAKLENEGATAVDAVKAIMTSFHIHTPLPHYIPQTEKLNWLLADTHELQLRHRLLREFMKPRSSRQKAGRNSCLPQGGGTPNDSQAPNARIVTTDVVDD
jgi:hypothetical protein